MPASTDLGPRLDDAPDRAAAPGSGAGHPESGAGGPLVSIIMPAWRPRPDWLREAVESALGQRGCNVEVIVVDDGSWYPVSHLLDDIEDGRLRVIRIRHSGHAAARNAGFAASRGDWIRHVDCDDVLELDSTAHLLTLAAGREVIAYGSTLVCDEDLRPRYVLSSDLQGHAAEACLLGRFEARGPALLFPRKVLERAGPWDSGYRVSADWDFVLRALEHAPLIGDRRVAFRYRRHGSSISMTANIAAGEIARARMIERFFERHPERRGSALERQAWTALHLDRADAYWSRGHRAEAAVRFRRALRVDPLGGSAGIARWVLTRAWRRVRPRR